MAKKNSVSLRADPDLKKIIDEMRFERYRQGKDKEPIKTPRMTKAIANFLKDPKRKKFIIDSNIR